MGLFDKIKPNSGGVDLGVIDSGRQKKTGGHDHRTNKGDDRTQAQKQGDKDRKK